MNCLMTLRHLLMTTYVAYEYEYSDFVFYGLKSLGFATKVNSLRPNGNYMYHLL
jgi:hypothetical protein